MQQRSTERDRDPVNAEACKKWVVSSKSAKYKHSVVTRCPCESEARKARSAQHKKKDEYEFWKEIVECNKIIRSLQI